MHLYTDRTLYLHMDRILYLYTDRTMHLYTAIKVAGAVNDNDDFEGGLFVINHIYGSYIVPIYGSCNVFTYGSYVVCRHGFILYLYTDHFLLLYTANKMAGTVNADDDFEDGLFVMSHVNGSYIVVI